MCVYVLGVFRLSDFTLSVCCRLLCLGVGSCRGVLGRGMFCRAESNMQMCISVTAWKMIGLCVRISGKMCVLFRIKSDVKAS